MGIRITQRSRSKRNAIHGFLDPISMHRCEELDFEHFQNQDLDFEQLRN